MSTWAFPLITEWLSTPHAARAPGRRLCFADGSGKPPIHVPKRRAAGATRRDGRRPGCRTLTISSLLWSDNRHDLELYDYATKLVGRRRRRVPRPAPADAADAERGGVQGVARGARDVRPEEQTAGFCKSPQNPPSSDARDWQASEAPMARQVDPWVGATAGGRRRRRDKVRDGQAHVRFAG